MYIRSIQSGEARITRLAAHLRTLNARGDSWPDEATSETKEREDRFEGLLWHVVALTENVKRMQREANLEAAADRAREKLDIYEYNALALRIRNQVLEQQRRQQDQQQKQFNPLLADLDFTVHESSDLEFTVHDWQDRSEG
jgi:hypothetical protein